MLIVEEIPLTVVEIRIKEFGSVRRSVRPFFMMVRFGSAEPKKRQFGRTLINSPDNRRHIFNEVPLIFFSPLQK